MDREARQHGAVSETDERSLHVLRRHLVPVVTAQPSQSQPEQETRHGITKALHHPGGVRPPRESGDASAWKRPFGKRSPETRRLLCNGYKVSRPMGAAHEALLSPCCSDLIRDGSHGFNLPVCTQRVKHLPNIELQSIP